MTHLLSRFALSDALKDKLHELFLNLIWPAAAGNVAWTFLTVAIDKAAYHQFDRAERLCALGLMAGYLTVGWWHGNGKKGNQFGNWYWFWDALHVSSIVVFSLGVQLKRPEASSALAAVFVLTAIPHLLCAWQPKSTRSLETGWRLAAINLVGVLILMTCNILSGQSAHQYFLNDADSNGIGSARPDLSFAISGVLALWFLARSRGYKSS